MKALPIQQLIGVLDRLGEAHVTLLELAERKKEALIRNDVDEVSAIVNKETRMSRMVDELLQEQAAATNAFFQSRGLQPTRAVTVTELSRLVFDPEEKKSLIAARDRLAGIIERLKNVNELNQQLIEQSLSFINYSLDLVLGPEEEPVYRNPLNQQGSKQRLGYFDSKA